MNDQKDAALSKITRESLLNAGSLVISGCAFEVRVTALDPNGAEAPAVLACFRKLQPKIAEIAKTALEKSFGHKIGLKIDPKARNYILGPIGFVDGCLRITIYGHDKEIQERSTYGGERWVAKVDKFQFLMQKDIQEILSEDHNQSESVVNICWVPGGGLLCSDHLYDPSGKEPALSADIRRLRAFRTDTIATAIYSLNASC